jgi:DNA polymerase-4
LRHKRPFHNHALRELLEFCSRSVPFAVSSRSDLERLSIALLQNEMPLPRPVRLLGISLSSLQGDEQDEPQLGLPI